MSWQPIETAPFDGRAILLFCDAAHIPIMARFEPQGTGWTCMLAPHFVNVNDGTKATHWMPLPEPPK